MSSQASSESHSPMTPVQWLICIIAAIGFMFDTYEIVMMPVVVKPALTSLGVAKQLADGGFNPAYKIWTAAVMLGPAVVGGIFGLLGGYLTDLIGRRRMLTFSILLYAVSAFCSGFSTTPAMLLVFRCLTFMGVCLEFVAATAWLAELFSDPKRRERVLGYTQAFGSPGGLLVAAIYGLLVAGETSGALPALAIPDWLNVFGGTMADPSAAWRFTLMSGVIPALPLIFIRPFLPESPEWKQKKEARTLGRPSVLALFSPELRRTTIITTLMVACSFGGAFGAILHVSRMLGALPEIKQEQVELKERAPSAGWSADELKKRQGNAVADDRAIINGWQEAGGIIGRIILAILAVWIVSRRTLFRIFLIPGLIMMPLTFAFAVTQSVGLFSLCMFLVALFTIAQFSFWGNYLPRVYPIHLRGTGESCAANIGGRVLGTSFFAVTVALSSAGWMPGEGTEEKLAYAAATVGTIVFAANFILSFWMPEPAADTVVESPSPEVPRETTVPA